MSELELLQLESIVVEFDARMAGRFVFRRRAEEGHKLQPEMERWFDDVDDAVKFLTSFFGVAGR